MFKPIKITDEQHNSFVKNHKYGDICQLTSWSDVKSPFWYSKRISIGDENNNIQGVAQLLFRKVPKINKTICYVSRGFVCNYEEIELVNELLKETIKIAKQENSFVITIDPTVKRKEMPNLHLKLKELGFKHKGFNVGFKNNQPRFTMVTDISENIDEVLKSFNSRAKTNIKKSIKYGLSFEISDIDELDTFYNIMKETGDRDGFSVRGKSYFEGLLKALKPDNDGFLVLIKMYPKTTFESLKSEYMSILKDLKRIEDKISKNTDENKSKNLQIQHEEAINRKIKTESLMKSIEPLVEKNEPVSLSGAILTYCGKKAYYLYGASSNEYRELLSNYFMQWKMIEFSKERNCTSYDFGGISGIMDESDHEYGLFDFKRRFNSEVKENIGEFDYVINPLLYKSLNIFLNIRKFIKKIINRA